MKIYDTGVRHKIWSLISQALIDQSGFSFLIDKKFYQKLNSSFKIIIFFTA